MRLLRDICYNAVPRSGLENLFGDFLYGHVNCYINFVLPYCIILFFLVAYIHGVLPKTVSGSPFARYI